MVNSRTPAQINYFGHVYSFIIFLLLAKVLGFLHSIVFSYSARTVKKICPSWEGY